MANLGSTLINGNLTVSGNINGYKLAAASSKGVDTSLSAGTTSENIPTSKAIVDYVTTAINNWKSNNTKNLGSISVSTSSNANGGLDISASASLASGYYAGGTMTGSATIAASSVSSSSSASQSFTPTIAAAGGGNVASTGTTSKPGSGFYIAVGSGAQSAKTISATATATTGYVANTTTKTSSGSVSLNASATTYFPIKSAKFAYNSDSTGATFIQCSEGGYVDAGALNPSGSIDGVVFNISYNSSIKNDDGTTGILKIYSPTGSYDPGTNAATISPTISNFNAGYVSSSNTVLNNIRTTYIPMLSTTTNASYTAPSVTTTVSGGGAKLSSTANSWSFTVKNSSSNGSYTVTTTHALRDGNTYKDSQYGLVRVGSESSGGNTIGVNKSADATYYIQGGGNSFNMTSAGIKTSSTDTGYSVSASSSVSEGYQGSDSHSQTTYIQTTSLSDSGVTGTGTFTPSISKNSATNVSSSAITTTKPSGYFVAVNSNAQGATTVSGTVSSGEGYITAQSKTISGSVGLAASSVHYVPITSGNYSVSTSPGGSFNNGDCTFNGGNSSGVYVSANLSSSATASVSTGYISAGSKGANGSGSMGTYLTNVNIPNGKSLTASPSSGGTLSIPAGSTGTVKYGNWNIAYNSSSGSLIFTYAG